MLHFINLDEGYLYKLTNWMDIETGQNNDKLHIDKEITSIIQRYSMFEKMKLVQTYHKQPVPFLVFKTC